MVKFCLSLTEHLFTHCSALYIIPLELLKNWEQHNETLFFRACFWPFLNSLNYKTRLLLRSTFVIEDLDFYSIPFFNYFRGKGPAIPIAFIFTKKIRLKSMREKNYFFVDDFCSKIANEESWPQQKTHDFCVANSS